jgi:hypothetical protein
MILAALLAAPAATAQSAGVVDMRRVGEQLGLDIVQSAGGQRLSYRIRDRHGRPSRLAFTVSDQAISASRGRFQAYRPAELRELAQADRVRRIRETLDQLGRRYPHVTFTADDDGAVRWAIAPPSDFDRRQRRLFDEVVQAEVEALRARYPQARIELSDGRFRVQAPDASTLQALESALKAAAERANAEVAALAGRLQDGMAADAATLRTEIERELGGIDATMEGFAADFFRERHYRLIRTPDGERLIQPDFARIARAAAPHLAEAAAAVRDWTLADTGDGRRRSVLNGLLLFVQSIPYDALGDRADSAGFLPPIQLLLENRGDCDSKSVLFAALAHQLYPDLPLAMVLLSGHAYVALGFAPEAFDTSLDYDGRRWTVAEPVGPHVSLIGELAPDTGAEGGRVESVIRLFN